MLSDIIPALPHALVVIACVIRVRNTGIGFHEQVGDLCMIVASRLVVSRCGRSRNGETCVCGNSRRLVKIAALCGDENDSECSSGTIDRCRRCILQHGNGRDVVGIDSSEVSLHSIDQNQRTSSVRRCVSSDIEVGRGVRTSRAVGDVQVRHHSLQSLSYTCYRSVLKFIRIHCSHSTGEVHLLLDSIADHYRFCKKLVIFLQIDRHCRRYSPPHGQSLCLITHADHCQCLIGTGQ